MFALVNSRNATIRRVASFPTCGSYLSLFLMRPELRDYTAQPHYNHTPTELYLFTAQYLTQDLIAQPAQGTPVEILAVETHDHQ